ncbi:MAG: hypothetical protein KZQ84_00505 [Candidatus Thiodiazotropha sp. (ex Lucinoma borealis)]|nr:hypothetical protein [Candidatus Thiodiazotropha sp. (ex Lucinoma borealis)]
MIRYLVVIGLGLFFGLHPKKVPIKRLLVLFASNLALIAVFVAAGASLGFDFTEIILLKKNHVIVTALTVSYALQLGLIIKLIRSSAKSSVEKVDNTS